MRSVAVIGGGQSAEHDVSLGSAASVAAALSRTGHDVVEITIGRDGVWRSGSAALGESPASSVGGAMAVLERADVVYPVLHGIPGEDGAIAALCALGRLPVAGTALRAGAVAMDKHLTKVVAAAGGVRVAPGVLIAESDDLESAAELLESCGEVVVKPVSAGSSHGVGVARDAHGLVDAVSDARRFDPRVIVEPRIRGREIDVAVLRDADGSRFAAPALEIHAGGLFDTAQKYDGTARFTVPARIDADLARGLRHAAVRMFDALGCAGVARLDFFATDDGLILNEVNTTPGMTEHSQVPRMFAAAGVAYEDLVARIVAGATVPAAGAVR